MSIRPITVGPERSRDIALLSFLCSMPVLLYGSIVRLWWTYDDAFLLHFVIRHHPREYLFSPKVWGEIPQRLFTPVLTLAYDTDVVLFGVNSRGYYGHQLLELTVLALLFYVVLRQWFGRFGSTAATVVMLCGTPMCAWASQLMLRHYVESSIAALAGTLLWITALKRANLWLLWLSGIAYFVAICAKEIAVPLPFFLLIVPEENLGTRAKSLLPQGIALVVYSAWRTYMLGTAFGGYGWAVTPQEIPDLVASLPGKIIRAWTGPTVSLGIVCLVLIVLVAVPAVRSRRNTTLLAWGLALAILPIAPASKEMQLRFAMPAWFVLSVTIAATLDSLRRDDSTRRLAGVPFAIVIVAALVLNRSQWRHTFYEASRMSQEGRTFLTLNKGEIIRNPLVPPAAMGELAWLKTEILHAPAGAAWTYDDIFFCGRHLNSRVVEFEQGEMRDVTSMIGSYSSRYCGGQRDNVPLEVSFVHKDEVLFWKLGPYQGGHYRFVIGDGTQAFEVPREDGFQLTGVPALSLRVRYTASDGWTTYSPELTMDFAKTAGLHWRRDRQVTNQ